MTRRVVAVLVPMPAAALPTHAANGHATGIGPGLRLAMVEDVYETVAALEMVEPALVALADDPACDAVAAMTWPGTSVHLLPETPGTHGSVTSRALQVLAETGAEQVTLVAGDAPDLPGLLIGKLHRALGSAEVAVLPSATGGLVAVASRCPLPAWLSTADGDTHRGIDTHRGFDTHRGIDIDAADGIAALQGRAPRRTSVSVGPGWHRVRTTADLALLDPGLEGWEVTRELLRR